MKNLKIGARLGLGFATVLLLLVCLTVIGIVRMHTASNLTAELVNVKVKNERLIAEWVKIIEVNSVRASAAYKMSDAVEQQGFETLMAASSARATAIQEQLGSSLQDPRAQLFYKQVQLSRKAYTETRKAVFAAKAAGDPARAKQLFDGAMAQQRDVYLGQLAGLVALQKQLLDVTAAEIAAQYASGRVLLISLGSLALLLGVAGAFWISGSITGPINAAVRVAETVAAGDLSGQIRADAGDETGQLMRALKTMNDNLVGIVGRVRSGTDTIATASREIAAGNLDLSSRTEQQASSLEETASSMEELTSTVKQNVDNARQANKLALDAADIASRGGAVVAEVVSTMGSINDSSRKIVDIISVIDGIAFQTNILALNAAVEAARAGEQGRGFAVVASEVRNLAHRSAAAAKEIKGLIDDSVQKVEAGSGLVDKAGRTMDEIVQSIGFVTSIMNDISHASEEQSAGIEQVNRAITEMDQVTQQNAALVEQASAAAEAMQEQSGQLAVLVGQFKLDGHGAAPVTVTPAPLTVAPAPAARAAVAGRVARPAARVAASTPAPAAPAAQDQWEQF